MKSVNCRCPFYTEYFRLSFFACFDALILLLCLVSIYVSLFNSVKVVMDYFICFSLLKNVKAVLSTETPKGAVLSINGIRTISMMWVILGHTFIMASGAGNVSFSSLLAYFIYFCSVFVCFSSSFFSPFFFTDNPADEYKMLNRFTFLPITNAFFSVDSFFLLR